MEIETQILKLMQEAGKPVSVGEIKKTANFDSKIIDKTFKILKEKGLIVSPVRCKWEPAQK